MSIDPMTSPTQRAGADALRELAAKIREPVTMSQFVDSHALASSLLCERAMIADELDILAAALQARIAELEARNAASERDAVKWRNHVESSDASHTHRCRRCGWNYSPVAGTSEDCPACGFDGVGDARAQGQE